MGEAAHELRHLGRYSLLKRIATGGMGEVHLARLDSAQGVEKLFAIKLLLPQFAEEKSLVDMFITEARIAARIAHSNVCQVFELGMEKDELFIAMEYLRGVPATSILKTHKPLNPVSPKIAVAIVKQAAAGLQFAHELKDENGESLGVVHRDVSPGNIFITAGGTAKVLDFGVVKAKDSSHKTKTGALKGKFGYMSPEQIMAEPLDSRSDIFSLGIVLFELLTNRRLFTRDSEYATLKAITESPIPRLENFRADMPPLLGNVLATALARDPNHRYPTMRAFSQALTDAMKDSGGIADAAEISDYIQSKFAYQLGQIDTMLQEVRTGPTSGKPLATVPSLQPDDRTEVLTGARPNLEETSVANVEPDKIADTAKVYAVQEKRSNALAWAVAIVGLAIVGLAAVVLLRDGKPAPVAAGIVYEGQLSPERAGSPTNETETKEAAAGQAISEDAAVAPSESNARRKKPAKPKQHRCESKKSAEARNRCYVTAEGRKLTKCLRDHAAEVSGSPQLVLDFDLAASGKVVGVSVSPPQFASTTLGACVKSIAKKIRFGPQSGAIGFRIPLKINQK